MTDIYVIVNKFLPPGKKAAQVAHAVAGLVAENPHSFEVFQAAIYGRMIVLDCIDPTFMWRYGLLDYSFIEPDLGNAITATAFLVREEERYLFSQLELSYKKKWWQVWK